MSNSYFIFTFQFKTRCNLIQHNVYWLKHSSICKCAFVLNNSSSDNVFVILIIKKNGISIAETAIQPSRQNLVNGSGQQVDSVMFVSPIFRVNNGDNVRIDVSMDDDCVAMLNLNVFLQEI